MLLQRPGAGPLLGVPFVLARHSQPLRAPLWLACGCGDRRSHSRQPMERSILHRSLSSFPVLSVPGQTTVAKLENLQNVTNKPVITVQLLIWYLYEIRLNQSIWRLQSCFKRSLVFSAAVRGTPDKTSHTHQPVKF